MYNKVGNVHVNKFYSIRTIIVPHKGHAEVAMIISATSNNTSNWKIVLARVIGAILKMAEMLENKYRNLENESYILLKMRTWHFIFP